MSHKKLSDHVEVIRAGWADKEKASVGLKHKEKISVHRNDEEGISKVEELVGRADQPSEVTIFIRRRHFPVMLASVSSSNGGSISASASFSPEASSPNPPAANATSGLATCASVGMGMGERTASVTNDELKDALRIHIIDEPTPKIRRKETTLDSVGGVESMYNLPPGARIVGDRVFLPNPHGGPETNLPLTFFSRKQEAGLFGNRDHNPFITSGGGGGGIFGAGNNNDNFLHIGAGSSLFGSSKGKPAPGLFGSAGTKQREGVDIFNVKPASGFTFGGPSNNNSTKAESKDSKPTKSAKPAADPFAFGTTGSAPRPFGSNPFAPSSNAPAFGSGGGGLQFGANPRHTGQQPPQSFAFSFDDDGL